MGVGPADSRLAGTAGRSMAASAPRNVGAIGVLLEESSKIT